MVNDELGVKLVQEVLTKDKVFREVNAAEQSYWGTPEYRYYQLRAQMAKMDRKAIEETHLDEATAKGMAEGIAEGRVETALNLLQMGFEPDKIAQATEMLLEEIKMIKARMSD